MRTRSLLLFLLALCLGGGTTILARSWLEQQQQAAQAQAAPRAFIPAPTKQILVARAAIKRGQILRPSDLTWRSWPTGGISQNDIVAGTRSADSFAGWVARDAIAPGDPLTEAKVVAPGDRGFLAAVLQPGMRAVSVPVTATSGISGFVFPGDRVDILVTQVVSSPTTGDAGQGGRTEHKVAETVLRNVRVIGIDQKLQGKEGEATLAHTATLEVTPKQSEIIAVASEMGKLSLSLRSLAQPTEPQDRPDSPIAANAETYTFDSEVSPILSKPFAQSENSVVANVTILRGNGKAGETPASQPVARGQ
jgi:pilus assembly protein CpaB